VSERRSILLLCDESRSHAANVLQHIEALATLSEHDVYRFNPLDRPDACQRLDLSEFDAVAIHYTISLMSARYLPPPLPERLTRFEGLKVQFIQDEYRAVDAVTAAMRSLGIDVLFTCAPEPAAGAIYNSRLPSVTRVFTLPGYVPDELVGRQVAPMSERPRRPRSGARSSSTSPAEAFAATSRPAKTTGSTGRTGTASWLRAEPRSAQRAALRLSTSTVASRRSARTTSPGGRMRPRRRSSAT
jgi:hypothetical protein